MTKDELKQLAHLNREVNLLQDQIDKIPIEHGTVTGSSPEFPYTMHNIIVSGYENERYIRIAMRLEEKKNECLDKIDELTAYINSVDDSLIRQLLLLRFVQCKKWDEIEIVMGGSCSGDQLRKKLERFLQKS